MITATEQTTADRVEALHAQLTERLATLTTSEEWMTYLRAAARFHTYSANNVWLILMQRPEAIRVAGFHTWKAVGRSVVKGAKGIKILAPCSYTARDDEGDPVLDAEGNARRMVRGFRVVHVFDLADTAGEPLPGVGAELLDGDAPSDLWDALGSQVLRAGFTLTRGDCGRANGLTDFAGRIVRVRDGLSGAQAAKTLAHELAHVLLHDDPLNRRTRDHREVEAESVAYIVLRAQGIETDGYSLPYVAGWSGGKPEVVADTAARVLATAAAILGALAEGR
jgi:N-terminal domain of anti-restriction factor ArdC/IrrE N-terminal-like domain